MLVVVSEMPEHSAREALLWQLIAKNRQRRRALHTALRSVYQRRQLLLRVACLTVLLLANNNGAAVLSRSCRRFQRNVGWFTNLWSTYSEKRFQETFRISRSTFLFILGRIRHLIEKDTITEEPISPECRLAIYLYRLARGDYYFTIAEMAGIGERTVGYIVNEVTSVIVECLWEDSVTKHMPKSEDEFKSKILDMEEAWQFPCCWSAVDGCHIPIKCPPGGLESCKEYHNFKIFFSVVLMGMVDSKYRFVWASCGYPGNSHDSVNFQSTDLWNQIKNQDYLPKIGKKVGSLLVPPLILGDAAFPLQPWLMKPCTNANPTPQQRYYNYRLSRARMVTEGAFGQLKGRWRVLLRRCECSQENTKKAALACVVLHNICLEKGDTITREMDLAIDPKTGNRRDRATIRRTSSNESLRQDT